MEKPKIRFKSFEKRWESYRLSEYSNYRRGSFPQPYGNKEWYGGDNAMPFVQVVDVLENLRLVADTKQKISTLAQPMSVFVPSDSVIVTLQGSIGRVAITQYDAYVDRTILIFEDYNSQTNKEFWAYTIRNKFEIERQKAPGGTIKTITKEALSDFKVSIPEYTEQSAIGSLFRILDDLLASYKDNLASYQSLKATMLSKMFPKTGQTVPEIRLDGFEGEWEEKYIGELADIVRGASPRPIQDPKWFDPNSEIGWLRISDVTSQNGRIHSLEQKISKLGQEKTRVLTEPHLLLSIAATVGKPVVNYVKTGVHDGFLIFMNPKFDREFMFQWLEMYREKWNRYGQPGSQVNLNSDIVKNQKILVPCMEEQQAIGSYFSNLDNLINSHQEKISQLETLKKKLLQDMFI
ncbi:MAG: restriction endonuclease subunit S [Streptococcus mitis]|nr:restriction endonuclease subunit S [Streptococcus mitis]